MNNELLTSLVSAALRAQRKAAFNETVERLNPMVVELIRNRPAGLFTITLPSQPSVDDDIRMAARNGNGDGLPPELLKELRDIEELDQKGDEPPEDGHAR